MLPVNVPMQQMENWNKVWPVVQDVFGTVFAPFFQNTYFGYFALVVLLVGVAMLLWRFFRQV